MFSKEKIRSDKMKKRNPTVRELVDELTKDDRYLIDKSEIFGQEQFTYVIDGKLYTIWSDIPDGKSAKSNKDVRKNAAWLSDDNCEVVYESFDEEVETYHDMCREVGGGQLIMDRERDRDYDFDIWLKTEFPKYKRRKKKQEIYDRDVKIRKKTHYPFD